MNSNIAKRCAHIAIATTLVAGLGVNHVWAAGPNEVVRSVVVRYADLDLSNPKDVHTLYYRLHAAARWACTSIGVEENDLMALSQYHRCIQQAMANAVANVNSEGLTQAYSRYNR